MSTAVPTTREEVKKVRFFINAAVDLCAATFTTRASGVLRIYTRCPALL